MRCGGEKHRSPAGGFTLLEMIVATTIMAIALVGLLAGISGSTHNAARLQDYDRAVQLGRARMDEMMIDLRLPHDVQLSGAFDTHQTGGFEAGRPRVTTPSDIKPAGPAQ